MARRRDLPPRVHLRHGAYYWIQPGTERWRRLSAERDGLPAMYRALATVTDSLERPDTMPAVISRWEQAKQPAWGAKTRLRMAAIARELASVFAEFAPAEVTTPAVYEYLQTKAHMPRTHNMIRNALSQVLAHAAIEGLREGHNPVSNIKGRSTPGRRRIVTDAEIDRLKAAARQQARNGEALVQMIELALLTGQRIGDIIGWRWQDVTSDHVKLGVDFSIVCAHNRVTGAAKHRHQPGHHHDHPCNPLQLRHHRPRRRDHHQRHGCLRAG